jgi:Cupin domain
MSEDESSPTGSVYVFVDRKMSGGAVTVLVSDVPPGGGPPPHTHTEEDETFTALEGEFELLVEGSGWGFQWACRCLRREGIAILFAMPGSTNGRLQIVVAPGGLEEFLVQLSKFSPATQMPEMMELAGRYGITFNLPEEGLGGVGVVL